MKINIYEIMKWKFHSVISKMGKDVVTGSKFTKILICVFIWENMEWNCIEKNPVETYNIDVYAFD